MAQEVGESSTTNANIPTENTPTLVTAAPTTASFSSSHHATLGAPVKLDRQNYLVWKAQVLATLRGHDLEQFISVHQLPPARLTESTNEADARRLIENPLYKVWVKQDQLILSWLLSSMSEGLASSVVNCRTALEIWVNLEKSFASQAKAKVLQLRMQLQTTKKGAMSISDYFQKMRSIADHLSVSGSPITDEDFILYILSGLPMEFEPTIANITGRADLPTSDEVFALLLSQENRLEHYNLSNSLDVQNNISANLAQNTNNQQRNNGRNNGRNYGNNQGFGNRGNNYQYQNQNQRVRGRGRNYGGRNGRPTCQICYKVGHLASVCYFRNDENYIPPQQQQGAPRNNQAYVATPETVADPNWILDSGATNHVTNDLANLNVRTEYNGPERLVIGNGYEHGESSTSSRAT